MIQMNLLTNRLTDFKNELIVAWENNGGKG